ncbi:MAG: hypothetical protein JW774_12100 [Candidatus Aureabacteria bacterium]|nr:hypothetical protein [Candidatus Auribacterota bacterium]
MSPVFSLLSPTITRWPGRSDEKISRILDIARKEDIFKDFLWTTPPIQARSIDNRFEFSGRTFQLKEIPSGLSICYQGKEYQFKRQTSKNLYYSGLSDLKKTTRMERRWVPKTRMSLERVAVTKSRIVHRTSFDSHGRMQTRPQHEFYTDWETRHVPKTHYEWENRIMPCYEIPECSYYDIKLDGVPRFIIYPSSNEGKNRFYIQNPAYLISTEKNKTLFGSKDINLIFIDTNSNGIFMEKDDKMLFNVWNPYDPKSTYRSIRHLMDNEWYSLSYLFDNQFLSFSLKGHQLSINYENEKYLTSTKLGKLVIHNMEHPHAKLFINGKEYSASFKKAIKIQYGLYKLRICIPGYADYEESFVINETNPEQTISYVLPEKAGILEIKNIFINNWFLVITHENIPRIYYNLPVVSVPEGECTAQIYVNGFVFNKSFNISTGQKITIDFEKEIQTLLTSSSSR